MLGIHLANADSLQGSGMCTAIAACSKRTAGNRQERQEYFIPFAFRCATAGTNSDASLFPIGIMLAPLFIGLADRFVVIIGSIRRRLAGL
jgi:hypothetical protein